MAGWQPSFCQATGFRLYLRSRPESITALWASSSTVPSYSARRRSRYLIALITTGYGTRELSITIGLIISTLMTSVLLPYLQEQANTNSTDRSYNHRNYNNIIIYRRSALKFILPTIPVMIRGDWNTATRISISQCSLWQDTTRCINWVGTRIHGAINTFKPRLEHTYHTYYIFGIIRTYFNVWNLIIRESYCGLIFSARAGL